MKLAFFRPAQANYFPSAPIRHQLGVPLSCGSTINEHLAAASLVGNLGNMIHRMAMIQMLEFDRANSGQVHIWKLIAETGGAKQAAEVLNQNFDGLVLTMSNILRPGATEPKLAELVRALKIPVYCFGVGLQNELPLGDSSSLNKDIMDLMKALDDKAALFAVRGETTQRWLRSVGIKKALALGCPSLFAYPKNILSIKAPSSPKRFITAGHLALTKNQNSRFHRLIKGFEGLNASYVFQGEIAYFKEILDVQGIYDEATQTADAAVLNEYLTKKCGIKYNFDKYYSFTDTGAWRQAYTNYDVYAGDRIHGGVAALQVGKPALIIYEDARVLELAHHHGIPSCPLAQFEKIGCQAAIKKYLNAAAIAKFHERYQTVLNTFNKAVTGAGLKLVNRV